MLDSMLCSSAVQHLIIRIRSLISTCSVAVWYNCTEAELFQPLPSSASGLAVLARFLGIGSGFLWFWELLPLVLGAAFFGCGSGFLWYWERLSFVLSSLVAFELSECSVAASGIAVLIDPGIVDDVALPDEPGGVQHSFSHSALILSSSIFVNNFLETICDSAWHNA